MGGERKVRSDKKRDIKPTISVKLKQRIYAIAEIAEQPVKDLCEDLCVKACESELIIDEIRQWFRRNYYYKNHIVYGNYVMPPLRVVSRGESERITIKFKQEDYEKKICQVAQALEINPTSTVALLLGVSLRHVEFMDTYLSYYLSHLSKKNLKGIEKLLREIQGYREV